DMHLDNDFSFVKRRSLDECVSFVVEECDKLIRILPMNIVDSSKFGRPTAAAALALKARVLLYDASPLWNGNADYANFVDKNGMKLFSDTYDAERWQIAAEANKQCIELTEAAGYALYRGSSNYP